MANLLPFTLLSMRAFKRAYPDRTLILAGVGPKAVETLILERFEWVDVIVRGESEELAPTLLATLQAGGSLHGVPGVSFRDGDGRVVHGAHSPKLQADDGRREIATRSTLG